MCNAWNHQPECECGWGGSGSGGWGGGISDRRLTWSSFDSRSAEPQRNHRVSFSTGIASAETRPIDCWWCGAAVYYHTNGYGDSVLFDSLGQPWQVHSCWTAHWQAEKLRRRSAGQELVSYPVILKQRLSPDQLKRLVLIGAVRSLEQSRLLVTEASVAGQLGVSSTQLWRDYGDFYELYMESKIVRLRLKPMPIDLNRVYQKRQM